LPSGDGATTKLRENSHWREQNDRSKRKKSPKTPAQILASPCGSYGELEAGTAVLLATPTLTLLRRAAVRALEGARYQYVGLQNRPRQTQ